MEFSDRLAQDRAKLVSNYADLILGTYPAETQAVWRKQTDRFANPVGTAILEAAQELIDAFLAWDDAEQVSHALEALVRIRSVQNFKPSQALCFVYLLKKVLRDAYLKELAASGELQALMALETRIDNMGLIAFDLYSKTREQIFAMRVEEVKRAQYNLLRRARMIVDSPAAGADER
ncbi:MAG: RsbRD N-terminal domain-containing protein [Desulfovibrio sp.]